MYVIIHKIYLNFDPKRIPKRINNRQGKSGFKKNQYM